MPSFLLNTHSSVPLCGTKVQPPLWDQGTTPSVGPRYTILCGTKVHHPLLDQGTTPSVGSRYNPLCGTKVHHPLWDQGILTLWDQGIPSFVGPRYTYFVGPRYNNPFEGPICQQQQNMYINMFSSLEIKYQPEVKVIQPLKIDNCSFPEYGFNLVSNIESGN